MNKVINRFAGQYAFLSNFYPSIFTLEIYSKRFEFATVEHGYQGFKATNLSDLQLFTTSNNLTAGEAKRLGRKIKMREDWDNVKDWVMGMMLDVKFSDENHPELHQKLLDTDPHELVEGNTWGDTYWGVCNGVGKNKLGNMLMRIRNEKLFALKFTTQENNE